MAALQPMQDCTCRWVVCNPKSKTLLHGTQPSACSLKRWARELIEERCKPYLGDTSLTSPHYRTPRAKLAPSWHHQTDGIQCLDVINSQSAFERRLRASLSTRASAQAVARPHAAPAAVKENLGPSSKHSKQDMLPAVIVKPSLSIGWTSRDQPQSEVRRQCHGADPLEQRPWISESRAQAPI